MRATVSAPIAKAILNDSINALDIEKPDGGLDKEYQWYETKFYTVPDVIGMTKSEAKSQLKNFQIEYSGSGDKIISTSPTAGSRIAENSIIRVMLSD